MTDFTEAVRIANAVRLCGLLHHQLGIGLKLAWATLNPPETAMKMMTVADLAGELRRWIVAEASLSLLQDPDEPFVEPEKNRVYHDNLRWQIRQAGMSLNCIEDREHDVLAQWVLTNIGLLTLCSGSKGKSAAAAWRLYNALAGGGYYLTDGKHIRQVSHTRYETLISPRWLLPICEAGE